MIVEKKKFFLHSTFRTIFRVSDIKTNLLKNNNEKRQIADTKCKFCAHIAEIRIDLESVGKIFERGNDGSALVVSKCFFFNASKRYNVCCLGNKTAESKA